MADINEVVRALIGIINFAGPFRAERAGQEVINMTGPDGIVYEVRVQTLK